MAENEASFKQLGNICKTSGEICRIGSYIAQSGHKVDVTEDDIEGFYSSSSDHIPIGIAHIEQNDPHYTETLGYALKLFKDSNALSHEGMVFDSDSFNNAVLMGYNSISPEFAYTKDASGLITDKKIIRLALVKNPAIETNKTNITRFAFSAPEVNEVPPMSENPQPPSTEPMKDEKPPFVANDSWANPAPTTTTPAAPDMTELMKNMAAAITEGITGKVSAQIEALQSEIAALKSGATVTSAPVEPSTTTEATVTPAVTASVTDQASLPPEVFEQFAELNRQKQELQARVEKEEKQRYTEKLAELRSLGQNTPEKLVSHLNTYEQKIATLDAFKSAMVKSTPMNSDNAKPMSTEGGSKQNNTPLTIAELAKASRIALTEEEAEFCAKRMGIPLR